MSKKPKTCGECEYMDGFHKVIIHKVEKISDYCMVDNKFVNPENKCHHNPIQFKSKKKGEKK